MTKKAVELPGRSPMIREAEIVGSQTGAIGGFNWSLSEIMKTRPLPKEALARFNYLVQGKACTISINRVRKEIPLHIHKYNDEVQYYVEGKGEFRVGDNRYTIGPGTIIYIPMGTIHGGPIYEPVTLLAVFTPNFSIAKPDRIFVDKEGREYS